MAAARPRRRNAAETSPDADRPAAAWDVSGSVARSQRMFLTEMFRDGVFTRLYDLRPTDGSSSAVDVLRHVVEKMREAGAVRLDGTTWTAPKDAQVLREFYSWAQAGAGTGKKYKPQVRVCMGGPQLFPLTPPCNAGAQRFFSASIDVHKAFNMSGSTPPVGLVVCVAPQNAVVLADDVEGGVAAGVPERLTEEQDKLRRGCNLPLLAELGATRGTGNVHLIKRLAWRIERHYGGLIVAVPVGVLSMYATEPSVKRESAPGKLPPWLSVASYTDMYSTFFSATRIRRDASAHADDTPVAAAQEAATVASSTSWQLRTPAAMEDSEGESEEATPSDDDAASTASRRTSVSRSAPRAKSKGTKRKRQGNVGGRPPSDATLRKQRYQLNEARQEFLGALTSSIDRAQGRAVAAPPPAPVPAPAPAPNSHVDTSDAYERVAQRLGYWQMMFHDDAAVMELLPAAAATLDSMQAAAQPLPFRVRGTPAAPMDDLGKEKRYAIMMLQTIIALRQSGGT